MQSTGAGVTVPDATLLFTGDFSRSGTDLTLTGADGAKFVVAGYFETDTPPSLISPQGAMLTGDVVTSLAGPQFPGMYAQAGGGAATGAKEIGKVQTLEGSGSVVRANGVTETLKAGDPVFEGDVVMTGPASKMGIGFVDGTVFSMSSSARMVLNSLVYDANGSNNSMLFNLVEGSFVFAAGQIAPTGDMKIQTPVATMGIRGTAPTVDINSQTGTVNFSIVPNPGDEHVGNYTLYSLITGEAIGSISETGSYWVLTGADGSITQVEKTQDDLLKDSDAISQINSVYNTYQNNSQNPQAGPENNGPPSSGGFNTNPNEGENVDGGGQNNQGGGDTPPPPPPPGGDGTPPGNNPPPLNDLNNDPPLPIEDPTNGEGVNIINGTPGDDNPLNGTNGNDFIFGLAGNDVIYDQGGNDVVDAGEGHDIIVAGTGNDDYDGGEGTDAVDYSAATQSVEINIVDGTVDSAEFGFDTIARIERFVTGSGDDTFTFSADTGWFFDGGTGVDTVVIEGDINIDTRTALSDAENIEVIDLNETDANVFTIQADDIHGAGAGETPDNTMTFLGGEGDTLVLGSELKIQGQTRNGTWAFAGIDQETGLEIYQFTGDNEEVYATALVDPDINVVSEQEIGDQSAQTRTFFSLPLFTLFLTDGFADIDGGDELTFTVEPADPEGSLPAWLYFNAVTGELYGTPGRNDDSVVDIRVTATDENGAVLTQEFTLRTGEIGDNGFDVMLGSNGNDVIAGLDGDDIIAGRGGNDQLFGDAGDDHIVGDSIITLFGGDGRDDIIHGGDGDDLIIGDNEGGLAVGDGGDDTIHGGDGDDIIIGDNFLALFAGDGGNDTIFGGDGDDTIYGDNVDVLFGGAGGNDTITGGAGNDTITTGGGYDTVVFNSLLDGIDTITDFSPLDTLDLTTLLDGALPDLLPDGPELGDIIGQFVQAITNGNDTTVSVDLDGAGTEYNFTDVAVLQGVGIGTEIQVAIGDDQTTVESAATV